MSKIWLAFNVSHHFHVFNYRKYLRGFRLIKFIRVSGVGFGYSENETIPPSRMLLRRFPRLFLSVILQNNCEPLLGLRLIHIIPIIDILYYTVFQSRKMPYELQP